MFRCLAGLFCVVSLCAADQSCPWLDAATAAGILGGPVKTKLSATACQFVRLQLPSKLTIQVRRSAVAHTQFVSHRARCAEADPLKAIGNEAFLCARNHQVVGRVRDALFTIRLTMAGPASPANEWQRGIEQVAEAVAGALF